MLEDFERARIADYFTRISASLPNGRRASAIAITHLLPERPVFLHALADIADLRAVLPKPKSIDEAARSEASRHWRCDELDRARFTTAGDLLAYLEDTVPGERVVLLDIGGYFAPALPQVCDRFSGRILGIVEDTENGHRRYLSHGKPPCPVYSVARSPLKIPEDFLVGQSIVFSTEALIRSRGDILYGRGATVIGFGKLGSSVASMLHSRNVRVTVYDTDPIKLTHAMAQGFHTASSLREALQGAGIIVGATGNLALRRSDFERVPNGAYVASVTSSDDEMELDEIRGAYAREHLGPNITRYSRTGHYFYVLNGGNAVNFLHGASVGAFIFLVQAEILAAVALLADQEHETAHHELPTDIRESIAATWLEHFTGAP
ncbi:NAD(P)-binding domain-containing protein [Nocardiopsis sp. NPDC058631]|uniref:NAD(P)-binding domain-containing protein n=1 Tax=Nocardiopsis sp. NPDC058631 TaxID=3346566 RepID=UPI00365BF08B